MQISTGKGKYTESKHHQPKPAWKEIWNAQNTETNSGVAQKGSPRAESFMNKYLEMMEGGEW